MPGPVQSVERAAAILQLLADAEEPLALAQITVSLGLAKGTAHGLIRTLIDVGFVDQDTATGRYLVSADLLRLGVRGLDLNELRSRAMNWADALASRTGESARLAAFRDGQAVIAHHVFRAEGARQVMLTGTVVPLHASALGKVLLAFDPGAARSLVGVELDRLTHRTMVERQQLQRELAQIRDVGWAAAIGEVHQDSAGIAAPVRDRGGHVVASIGIEGDVSRLCDERMRPRPGLVGDVQRAARSVSRELGHGRAG